MNKKIYLNLTRFKVVMLPYDDAGQSALAALDMCEGEPTCRRYITTRQPCHVIVGSVVVVGGGGVVGGVIGGVVGQGGHEAIVLVVLLVLQNGEAHRSKR